jgi:hypothetical protein
VPLAGLLPITGPTKAEVLDKHKSGSDNQLARSVGRRRSQLRVSHKVDVAAWAARAANNSQPLAPGSYSATATYEIDPRYYSSLHPRMTHLAT